MRPSAPSVAFAALLFLSPAAGQGNGGFPNLSSVVEGGAKSTSQPAQKTGSPTSNNHGDFPTVTAGGDGVVPTYPPPTVPPTVDAPFMQKSTLPEGTVFIGVGAGLGFLLACVLLWRGFLMWTVHKNIKRANAGYLGLAPQGPQPSKKMGAGLLDGSVGLLKKKAPFYGSKTTDGSTMSLSPLNAVEPKSRQASGNTTLGTAPSKSSLFFSPTAGAAGAGGAAGIPAANLGVKRGDGYLPSGYYAGSNQTGPGMQERASQHFSMADFDGGPQAGAQYGSSLPPPPPRGRPGLRDGRRESYRDSYRDSQVLLVGNEGRRDSSYGSGAQRLGAGPNHSNLSLGSAVGGSQRAPSAYLEDLFSASPVPQNEQR